MMPNVQKSLFKPLIAALASAFLSACGGEGQTDLTKSLSTRPTNNSVGTQSAKARIVQEKMINARLMEITIETPSLNEPAQIYVNLPAGYNPEVRWPVTFYLAGTNHTYKSFNEIYGGEKLVADYPSIVVSPTGRSGYWSDWFNQSQGGPPKYETYLIKELLPLIEARFSTIGEREGRAVMGESMGGFGALMIASRHPDLFVAAASISGTVNTNLAPNAAVLSASPALDGAAPDSIYGPRATEEVRWRGHNPFDLASNLGSMTLWLGTANGLVRDPAIGETAMDQAGCGVEFGVSTASVSLHEELNRLGIKHVWRDFGAGCHSVPNFQRQIKEVLVLFKQTLASPKAAPIEISHRAIEPTFSVWNWTLQADPARALEFIDIKNASPKGLTVTGSGLTKIISPPFYKGVEQVTVTGGNPGTVTPDSDGRIQFTVDLGPPNSAQQYRPASMTSAQTITVKLGQ